MDREEQAMPNYYQLRRHAINALERGDLRMAVQCMMGAKQEKIRMEQREIAALQSALIQLGGQAMAKVMANDDKF